MELNGCYSVLFLLLGATVGALLAESNARRRSGLGKLKLSRTEMERSKEFRKKFKKARGSGYTDLFMAVLLSLAGLVLLFAIIYALSGP